MGRLRPLLFWASLAFGLTATAYAAYIPAKAWLAQVLLDVAWERRSVTGLAVRPWPWADMVPLARLRSARLDVEQIVLDGASGRVLAFGPGHVTGSAQPGTDGNVAISAHRDTHFRWLRRLVAGDVLELETADGDTRQYRVTRSAIHHESDVFLLDPHAGNQLRLITCYPFDAVDPGTPLRYVVTASPSRVAVTF